VSCVIPFKGTKAYEDRYALVGSCSECDIECLDNEFVARSMEIRSSSVVSHRRTASGRGI